ncbi:MAG: phosphoribosylamine--glycine ligase [Clostridia bacterium]|nr:phosphoribosylamine--glycine ligase [Clostridia bacterium]
MEKKNILIIGGGGREHAIAWKLKQSNRVGKLYAIPGNAGMAQIAECISDIKATDIDKIVEFVDKHDDIYMTVVAPDDPLAMGLVNRLNERGHRAFGPTKEAAIIEASKAFSKNLMKKYAIPTAKYEVFDSAEKAKEYVATCDIPVVLKADGLALGKGVLICTTREQALNGVKEIMEDKAFGAAGGKMVVEEFLTGQEVSVLAYCDGETVKPMPASRDHKRALDGDKGLNTGGMGAFSPVPMYTDKLKAKAEKEIFEPTVKAMKAEGRTFKGVLYFGLMVCGDKIKVLEYNARFGDPETQAVLPRLKTDLLDIFDATIDGTLDKLNIEYSKEACVCVVAASGGYPEKYEKGKIIDFGDSEKNAIVFHAGTAICGECGKIITNGGRVLGVTALGKDLKDARKKAYAALGMVGFEKMFYRSDICSDGL